MFKDLVKKCRSYRGYNEERNISEEELLELIDCARFCPSRANKQPLKYVLVLDKEVVEKILPQTKWAAGLTEKRLPYEGTHPAAFIVICQDTDIEPDIPAYQKDVGIAAYAITLSAAEKDLGALLICNFDPDAIKEILGLPEDLVPQLLIALGEPAETVVLTDVGKDGKTRYYRDENGVHYVPKRALEDVVAAVIK